MQGIEQSVTSSAQMAGSASAVASAMAKPRTAGTTGSGNSTNTSSTSSDSDSTITANDFLTLLVAEMQNQDPTQPTDPNEYISQMVDVNSLQQLIGINQGVSSLDTAAGVSSSSSTGDTNGTGSSQ